MSAPSLSLTDPFPSGALPARESLRRRVVVRSAAILSLVVTLAYLTWRVTSTLDMQWWWLAVPLFVVEAYAGLSLLLFTVNLWDLDALRPAPPVSDAPGRVALLIPTYDEPYEVLLPTIAAAVTLEPSHETWVLDDGDREWVRDLAARLGASYRSRVNGTHAKAGNLNEAIAAIDAEFVAVLDADHVATPAFLTKTLGYFTDPRLALVQTPQDFYNLDSFEHVKQRKRRYSEQALFYRALETGRNRWHAAFWCGTGAVLRVAALRDVGGVSTDSVTEDIHTTIRLHRRGWRTAYHNEVLARGLAAADSDQYLAQRVRWGTGAMQVLRSKDNPMWASGLTFMQRVSYLTTLGGWFEAWRTLAYVLLPMLTIVTGAVPIHAAAPTFLAWFVPTFVVQRVALQLLTRGYAPQGNATLFEFVRMPANLRATLTLLSRRPIPFRVTAKGRTGDGRQRRRPPLLLGALLLSSLLAAGWFAASMSGLTPTSYPIRWAAEGSAGWLAVNACILGLAIRRIRSDRYAGERRASVRFGVQGSAWFDGSIARVDDVSLTGARLLTGAAPRRNVATVLTLPGGAAPVSLRAVPRSARRTDDRWEVGVEFAPGQAEAQAALALALFGATAHAGLNHVPVQIRRRVAADTATFAAPQLELGSA